MDSDLRWLRQTLAVVSSAAAITGAVAMGEIGVPGRDPFALVGVAFAGAFVSGFCAALVMFIGATKDDLFDPKPCEGDDDD